MNNLLNKSELIKLYNQLSISIDRRATREDWEKSENTPSVTPVLRVFNNWSNFLQESGASNFKDKTHHKIRNFDLIKETEWAWLSGIIDGEACIHIVKVSGYFYLIVNVTMSHFPTIYKIYKTFGGCYNEKKMKNSGIKDQAIWFNHNSKIFTIELLKRVLPYSITKQKEVLAAIEFLNLPTARENKDKLINKDRERLYLKLKSLKRYRYIANPKRQKQ